jgi:Xaa-Pro aminopeptidase
MIRSDKSVRDPAPNVLEPGIDFNRLRRERLAKLQRAMAAGDIAALLLTNPVGIRYATGVSIMPLWTAVNLAHYALIPVEGDPVIFEYALAQFRVDPIWPGSRPAYFWQARFADQFASERSGQWAAEIRDVLAGWGLARGKLGVDVLDFHGFSALQEQGLRLTDADEPLQAARIIKTPDEIELLKQSAAVCEAALHDLKQAIRPGISEHELLGVFWHGMLALGGEHCSTRLLVSGHKTNPWFHEAGSKLVRPGDLVGIDTDMIGPEGYLCDISRTFLCGDQPTLVQKEAYQVAYDFVQATIELCTIGRSYRDIAARIPRIPEAYQAQRYRTILHGTGCDDEPPFIPFPDSKRNVMPEGELQENMVLSVEFYAGKVGAQDGVKLEEEIWITPQGPRVLSLYPYEPKLLR